MFHPKHQDLYAEKESATDSFGTRRQKVLDEAKIDIEEIAINSIPDIPIWDSEPITVESNFVSYTGRSKQGWLLHTVKSLI